MAVEGRVLLLFVLGATLGTLEFIPTIEVNKISSLLLGMLLAPPEDGNLLECMILVVLNKRCV